MKSIWYYDVKYQSIQLLPIENIYYHNAYYKKDLLFTGKVQQQHERWNHSKQGVFLRFGSQIFESVHHGESTEKSSSFRFTISSVFKIGPWGGFIGSVECLNSKDYMVAKWMISMRNTHTWESVVHSFGNVVVAVSSEKFIFRDQVKLRLNCLLLLTLSFFSTISSKVRAYKLTVWEKDMNTKFSILHQSSTDEFVFDSMHTCIAMLGTTKKIRCFS